jgi:two-component system LytT family response regulator
MPIEDSFVVRTIEGGYGPRFPLDASTPLGAGKRAPSPLQRIAVRSLNRIVIVRVETIVRLAAEDNYVRIWADRPYLHKATLTRLVAGLDPQRFLRVHRSHAINLDAVRELHPQAHGEYLIVMRDGTELTSGRSYRADMRQAFAI